MPDAVTRLNAALEGRYAIERELGERGMATVYLADDLPHPTCCSKSGGTACPPMANESSCRPQTPMRLLGRSTW